jgi:hypothetical protein
VAAAAGFFIKNFIFMKKSKTTKQQIKNQKNEYNEFNWSRSS